MSSPMTVDYFECLCDIINQINGKILLVGDLNIVAGRNDDDKYLDMIKSTGLSSKLNKPTRKGVQLDYCFSNYPLATCELASDLDIAVLSSNDHDALVITVKFKLDLIKVPARYVTRDELSNQTKNDIMKVGLSQILEANPEAPISLHTLEADILEWETKDALMDHRYVPEHTRVRHTSRQMSKTRLNPDLSPEQKFERLEAQRMTEAVRRLQSNVNSSSLASRLYGIFSQTSKSEQLLKCNIDPEEFARKINNDETRNCHANHPPRTQIPGIKLDHNEVVNQKLLKNIKSRWNDKAWFVPSFWRFIANGVFTQYDNGVHTYNSVGHVVKDKTLVDKPEGWRSVWITPAKSEKTIDFIRASFVNSSSLNNDAYCIDRSCQRTLYKIHNWYFGLDGGSLGIDFQNAFGLACRECSNALFGDTLLNPTIHYTCKTNNGRSELYLSKNGTGAGRATGGPGFNLCFEQVNNKLKLIVDEDKIAPFADDSQIRIPLNDIALTNQIVQCFKEAVDIGLEMHTQGKKGPTLLVANTNLVPSEYIEQVVGCDIKVVDNTVFLGLKCTIDTKTGFMMSSLTGKTKSTMGFYVNEMSRSMKFFNNNGPTRAAREDIVDSVSQSIAAFLESRIQYGIAYAEAETLTFYFNIHRKAICALLGLPTYIFGFKWKVCKPAYVNDLYNFLSQLCSPTYSRLCMIAGKPDILGLAFRAILVIESQRSTESRPRPNVFSRKIDTFARRYREDALSSHDTPKKNEFHQCWRAFKTIHSRRVYTLAATDCLIMTHLDARGFDVDTNCRLCGEHPETFKHIFDNHTNGNIDLPGGLTVSLRNTWIDRGLARSIRKFSSLESRQLPLRVSLLTDERITYTLTRVMENVIIPSKLKYKPPKLPKNKLKCSKSRKKRLAKK